MLCGNDRSVCGCRICIEVAEVEATEARRRNLVCRHTIVFETSAVEQLKLRSDAPFVGEIESELVLRTLCIFRTQLVVAEGFRAVCSLCRVERIDVHLAQRTRISLNGARPLERR